MFSSLLSAKLLQKLKKEKKKEKKKKTWDLFLGLWAQYLITMGHRVGLLETKQRELHFQLISFLFSLLYWKSQD